LVFEGLIFFRTPSFSVHLLRGPFPFICRKSVEFSSLAPPPPGAPCLPFHPFHLPKLSFLRAIRSETTRSQIDLPSRRTACDRSLPSLTFINSTPLPKPISPNQIYDRSEGDDAKFPARMSFFRPVINVFPSILKTPTSICFHPMDYRWFGGPTRPPG